MIVVVLVGAPSVAMRTPTSSSSSNQTSRASTLASSAAPAPPRTLAPAGSGGAVNGTFWTNHSVAGGTLINPSNFYCDEYYPGYFCFPQAAAPTVLPLANGQVGYAYEILTNTSTSTCPLAANNSTEIRVQFAISTDGGQNYGAAQDVGNTTCPYYQALEPSFAVSSSGDIFGAYVEANATPAELNCPAGCGPFWGQAVWYAPRTDDALAFVDSTDSGSSFHPTKTITQAGVGNIADPSLATFGNSIYIAYMNISNTSTGATLANSIASPISAELVYSSNGGANWNGPYTLPGYNATEYYNAMNPQVAVGPSGTVYVGYSSNRHCIGYCAYTTQAYGDDVYLASSTTNGTTWASHLVAQDEGTAEELGETPDGISFGNGPASGPYLFEEGPAITLAVAQGTGSIYVAWTGALNESAHYYCGPPTFTFSYGCIDLSYDQSVLMVATSTNGGSTWTNTSVGSYEDYYQQGAPNGEFLPGIGVSPSGTVYLTYAEYNGTAIANGCYQEGAYGDFGFEGQWVASSTNGQNWTGPDLLAWNINGMGGWWTTGWTSSVAFNVTTGAPLIGYTLTAPTNNLPTGPLNVYTWPGGVQIAMPYTGATTILTIHSTGLPTGTPWRAWVMGETYTSTASNLTIANAPIGRNLWVKTGLPPTYIGYGAAYLANITLPVSNGGDSFIGGQKFLNLTGPGAFWLNYSLYYFLNFSMQPESLEDGSLSFQIYDPANNYAQWVFYQNGAFGGGCAFPWLVPAGTQLHVTGYRGVGYLPAHELYYDDNGGGSIGFFNGTGPGSFTGAGPNITITMNGPMNETGWIGSYGVYNISVGAPSLPAGSPVHFTWGGTPYSFTAPGPILLHNVSTGTYAITNIWAGSTLAGYEYFGYSDNGNPVAIPNNPTVNLSFALVDIASPVGVVSFHANGTTPGTTWQFEVNGTIYSSSTPWINVSTRSGTFGVTGFPIVSANSTADFAPLGLASTLSVATGQTYLINYSRAYEVTVAPAQGGSISPSGSSYWVAPGTSESFTADASTGYSFAGWTGKGAGSYSGSSAMANVTAFGPIVETPSFVPLPANHFQLTFQEGSLPAGTPWSVFLDGIGYSTTSTTLTVSNLYSCSSGPIGAYTIAIPYVYVNGSNPVRYSPSGYPGSVCGGSPSVNAAFSPQYFLTLQSTAGGAITATPYSTGALSTESLWVSSGDTVGLQATPLSGYQFAEWNGTGFGSYSGPLNPEDLVLLGPVKEVAVFVPTSSAPAPMYSVDFRVPSALPPGITWTVVVGGSAHESTGSDLVVSGLLAGHYTVQVPTAVSPDGQTQAAAANAPSFVTVGPNATVPVTFRISYWVELTDVGSGTTSPASAWAPAGSQLQISASASVDDIFEGWAGTGNGSYSGGTAVENLTVAGPIHEVATFVPSGLLASSSSPGFWSSSSLIVGLAVVGLVAGTVGGILLGRRRTGGGDPAAAATPLYESTEEHP